MPILVDNYTIRHIVQEAYYGKSKELILIEKELDKVIKAIKRETNASALNKSKDTNTINNSDSVKMVNMLFKKAFGVKDFILTFYTGSQFIPNNMSMNAYTLPQTLTVFHHDWKKGGMRANADNLIVNVHVDKLLIVNCDFTAEELMGIILHEIGHNFDASIFKLIAHNLPPIGVMLDKEIKVNYPQLLLQNIVSGIYKELGIGKLYSAIQGFIENLLEKAPGLQKFIDFVSNTTASLSYIYGTILFPVNVITNAGVLFKNRLLRFDLFGYAGEKYSDSFATAYGYGNGLSTAMTKMEKRTFIKGVDEIRKIPVANVVFDLAETTARIVTFGVDCHPDEAIRILSQLKKMKRDIKDPSIPSSVRKQLESDIVEQEKILKKFTSKEYYVKEGRIFSMMWNKMLIEVFDGKLDPRELVELVARHEE